jgi:hypothetical protein
MEGEVVLWVCRQGRENKTKGEGHGRKEAKGEGRERERERGKERKEREREILTLRLVKYFVIEFIRPFAPPIYSLF